MTRPPYGEVAGQDIRIVSAQLGRPARNVVGVAARCVCGSPTVVATAPRLSDGTPFPTFYYLTLPAANVAVSKLEAEQFMVECAAMLEDVEFAEHYKSAHYDYLSDRATQGVVREIAGISAGGMPNRVKCLHALVAHSLAVGPGVNPVGDIALRSSGWSPLKCECVSYEVGSP